MKCHYSVGGFCRCFCSAGKTSKDPMLLDTLSLRYTLSYSHLTQFLFHNSRNSLPISKGNKAYIPHSGGVYFSVLFTTFSLTNMDFTP